MVNTKSNVEEWKYISKEFPNKLKYNLYSHQFKGTLTRARDHLLSLTGGCGGGVQGCLKIILEIKDILATGMETSQSESAKKQVERDITGSYSSIASASACNYVMQTTSSAILKSLSKPTEKHVDDVVVNAMDHKKTSEFIFKILKEAVLEVGDENVVQLVTDSTSNCVGVGKHATRELLRPCDTRFATYYITLNRVVEEKASLRLTVCSNEWEKSPLSNTSKEKLVEEIILSNNFWDGVEGF
eukprot:Gb_41611 [translate_table: standard]